jgi:protein-S-isoprenylcysteine O-methyltransferase Ste14
MSPTTDSVALFGAFVFYFAAAFVWPTLRVWRRTGVNPYVLPSTDDAYGFVTAGMRAVIVGLFVYVFLQMGRPDLEPALGALPWLAHRAVAIAGWAGLALATIWTVVAQYQMGRSWRIGIDTKHKTDLVTTGLFAWSRNPIFLAMRVSMFSLVLLRPNAATLALWLVGDVLIQFQVRLEEAFLAERHGAAYATYRSRVRRWI